MFCNEKKKIREFKRREKNKDQTRFSSFNDFIFVPVILPLDPFRSLKYSIGTMARKKKNKNDINTTKEFNFENQRGKSTVCVYLQRAYAKWKMIC